MKTCKKLFCALLTLCLLLTATACGGKSQADAPASGGQQTEPAPQEPAAQEEAHKVAMILPGSITDMSWNYTSYDGLKKIEAAGAEISYQEKVDTAQAEDSIRTYASSGYDLIYIGSNIFEEQTLAVAPDFPDTTFIIISGSTIQDNVCTFCKGEGSYPGKGLGLI